MFERWLATIALVGAMVEFAGGLLLLLGLLTPLGALAIVSVMIGAIAVQTGNGGFFIQNNGYEYNVTLSAIALALIALGPGRLSVDHTLGLADRARAVAGQLRKKESRAT